MREEAIPKPRRPARVRIMLDTKKISGDLVLQTKNLRVGYEADKPIVDAQDRELRRGERLALVGPNGAGKTTMLRTLLGQLKALTGKVRLGAGVHIGYLSQAQDELNPAESVLDTIKALKQVFPDENARTILGSFLFTGEDVFKKVRDLSGGERSRLALARISVLGATVLMLDEPTNHLDISSQEELQEALLNFDGTIIFVSHDRYLVQALASKLWIIDHGEVLEKDGGWDAYLAWRDGATSAPPEPKKTTPAEKEAEKASARAAEEAKQLEEQRRASQKDEQKRKRQAQKALERQKELEPKIAELEKKLEALNVEITKAGEAQKRDEVMRLGQEFQEADGALKALWDEWVQLGEVAEQK
ncbi:MAG: ATP-binding cassette domain-containing protein [Planctomycetota bacterium]|nr:ATP-binding cassette domain-containing protein [Planctomycetota bacterium]